MISVEDLATIISHKVHLRKVGNRFVGRCPFHSPDLRPSFHVFEGYDGEGRYYCQSCHNGGTARWWKRTVLNQAIIIAKPDPAIELEREWRRFAEGEWQALLDDNPNRSPEERLFVEIDLRESVRRRLQAKE